jgi:signal transduction histidine kinase
LVQDKTAEGGLIKKSIHCLCYSLELLGACNLLVFLFLSGILQYSYAKGCGRVLEQSHVAVDFLLFDIEVLFVIPFAVAFKSLLLAEATIGIPFGTYAFVGILVFIAMIVAGLVYTIKKGVLDWGLQARLEARAEAKNMAQAEKKARARAAVEGISA